MSEEKVTVKERWQGGWFQDFGRHGLVFYAPRLLYAGEEPKFDEQTDIRIPMMLVPQLLAVLKENGMTREGDRKEDIKIIHRLLDVTERFQDSLPMTKLVGKENDE